jgi:hypothetical protein
MSRRVIFSKYSYFARLAKAVSSICAVAAHKATDRDARYRPTCADAPNHPAQMSEHLAARHVAQMRCILESRQGRLGIQIAARVRQASLNAGSDRR